MIWPGGMREAIKFAGPQAHGVPDLEFLVICTKFLVLRGGPGDGF